MALVGPPDASGLAPYDDGMGNITMLPPDMGSGPGGGPIRPEPPPPPPPPPWEQQQIGLGQPEMPQELPQLPSPPVPAGVPETPSVALPFSQAESTPAPVASQGAAIVPPQAAPSQAQSATPATGPLTPQQAIEHNPASAADVARANAATEDEANRVADEALLAQQKIDSDLAAEKQAKVKEQRDELLRDEDEIAAKHAAIRNTDPKRAFHGHNATQRTMNFAAAMLSGFYSPYYGGKNMFLEQLDKEIDRDIDAQKQDQQIALEGVRLAERGYDRKKDVQAQEMLSYDWEKSKRLYAAAAMMAPQLASIKSQQTKNKLAGELQKIQAAAAAAALEAAQKEREWKQKLRNDASARAVQSANVRQSDAQTKKIDVERKLLENPQPKPLTVAEQKAAFELNAAMAPKILDQNSGKEITFRGDIVESNKTAWNEYQKERTPRVIMAQEVRQLADKAKAMKDTFLSRHTNLANLTSEEVQEFKTLQMAITEKLQTKMTGATASAQQRKSFEYMTGTDAVGFFKEGPAGALGAFADILADEENAQSRQFGPTDSKGKPYLPGELMRLPDERAAGRKAVNDISEEIRSVNWETAGEASKKGAVDLASTLPKRMANLGPAEAQAAIGSVYESMAAAAATKDMESAKKLLAVALAAEAAISKEVSDAGQALVKAQEVSKINHSGLTIKDDFADEQEKLQMAQEKAQQIKLAKSEEIKKLIAGIK